MAVMRSSSTPEIVTSFSSYQWLLTTSSEEWISVCKKTSFMTGHEANVLEVEDLLVNSTMGNGGIQRVGYFEELNGILSNLN